MKCARCGAAAEGPLSVTPNVHKMACAGCGLAWRQRRAKLGELAQDMVLQVFRLFMAERKGANA